MNAERVLTFREPRDDGYAHESVLERPAAPGTVAIHALDDVHVDLAGLFE